MSEVLVEARALSRRFGRNLDLVGRAAVALGLSRPPGVVRPTLGRVIRNGNAEVPVRRGTEPGKKTSNMQQTVV